MDQGNKNFFYVGSYTRRVPHAEGTSKGIHGYRFDESDGSMELVGQMADADNPTFLALDSQNRTLYAAGEIDDYDGQSAGFVSAYSINAENGALTYLNKQSSHGAAPCHVKVDGTDQYVIAANYTGGSVAIFPIQEDGRLAPTSDFIQHQGSSVNPNRQEGPHAHSANIDAQNRFVLVADLGTDKIFVYELDLENGKLLPHTPPSAQIHAGAGPRHLDFHPNGKLAYAINELDSTVVALAYDAEAGRLTPLQTISTLPAGFEEQSCADIHVHPSGKFVYGSNRGHDSIAMYSIDQESGHLTSLGFESTQGKTPRNFALSPSGNYLIAANQDTNTMASYSIDLETGTLTPTGHVIDSPTPVCIMFLR